LECYIATVYFTGNVDMASFYIPPYNPLLPLIHTNIVIIIKN